MPHKPVKLACRLEAEGWGGDRGIGYSILFTMTDMTGHTPVVPRTLIGQTAIFAIAMAYGFLYLGLPNKWWFEDDPVVFSYGRDVSNPIDFFIDPGILRHVATGVSAVPMWLLSYWIDGHLFSLSASVAYLHQLFSFGLVAVLLFTTFVRYGKDRQTSFLLVVIWMLLPSTVSVLSFLSTRHYLEGLGWAFLACYFLPDICENATSAPRKLGLYLITAFGLWAAMLSKEIYVPTLLVFFFLFGSAQKNLPVISLSILSAVSYWHYRRWMLGTANTYPVPLLHPVDYAKYLATIPYTLTLSHAGYLVYLACAIFMGTMIDKDKTSLKRSVILAVSVFLAGLASVYPTAFAVLQTYQIPGTWYRSPFIINTLFIIFFCWFLTKVTTRNARIVVLFMAIILVAPGNFRASVYWDARHLRAKAEGIFYLDNPDKLLYSEEDAYWFIPGLETLYAIKKSHYVDKINVKSDHSKAMLAEYPTIWRYQNGRYTQSDELYQYIQSNNAD